MKSNLIIYRFYNLNNGRELTDSFVHLVNVETINDHLPIAFYVNESLYGKLVDLGEIELVNGYFMVTLTYF